MSTNKRFVGYDPFIMKRILQWAIPHWGTEWVENVYMCTHPWVDMAKQLYGYFKDGQPAGAESFLLADKWFRRSTVTPAGRDPLLFRFQEETEAVDTNHPNGITHLELVLEYDPVTKHGVCMGVGIAAGPAPLNDHFSIHRFEPGLSGDGWFTEDATHKIHHRWVNMEYLL